MFDSVLKESSLLKCLECRLVGEPPKFNLPPPPPPPVFLPYEHLLNPESELFDSTASTAVIRMTPLQEKRCLKFKNYINKIDLQSNQSLNRFIATAADSSSASVAAASSSSLFVKSDNDNSLSSTINRVVQSSQSSSTGYGLSILNSLTSTQTLVIFIVCLLIFVLVLFGAFYFLIKLFRIKKQLAKSKLTSISSSSSADIANEINNKKRILNCLSSSLTSSSTSSSSSSSSSSTNSNTINSHLITPSSSLFIESVQHQQLNQQQQQQLPNQSYDNKPVILNDTNTIFYNQLFSFNNNINNNNNRRFILNANSNVKPQQQPQQQRQVEYLSETNGADTTPSYLQTVPTNQFLLDEYAEINNQHQQQQPQQIYNQYDSDVGSSSNNKYLIKTNNNLNSNSSTSIESSSLCQQTNATATTPLILNYPSLEFTNQLRNSAILIANNSNQLVFIKPNATQSTVNQSSMISSSNTSTSKLNNQLVKCLSDNNKSQNHLYYVC